MQQEAIKFNTLTESTKIRYSFPLEEYYGSVICVFENINELAQFLEGVAKCYILNFASCKNHSYTITFARKDNNNQWHLQHFMISCKNPSIINYYIQICEKFISDDYLSNFQKIQSELPQDNKKTLERFRPNCDYDVRSSGRIIRTYANNTPDDYSSNYVIMNHTLRTAIKNNNCNLLKFQQCLETIHDVIAIVDPDIYPKIKIFIGSTFYNTNFQKYILKRFGVKHSLHNPVFMNSRIYENFRKFIGGNILTTNPESIKKPNELDVIVKLDDESKYKYAHCFDGYTYTGIDKNMHKDARREVNITIHRNGNIKIITECDNYDRLDTILKNLCFIIFKASK